MAVAVVEFTLFKEEGTTSNGPPDVPSGFRAFVATPEKATMLPMAMSHRECIANE